MKSHTVVNVRTFGCFSITCTAGESSYQISDFERSSRKCWTLIEYLILNRERAVSREELVDVIWPDSDTDNSLNTLKTLVHRARAILEPLKLLRGSEFIILSGGMYSWNPLLMTDVDCELFDQLTDKLKETEDPAEATELRLKAIALYNGDFIPRASGESWVAERSADYHKRYVELCTSISGPMLEAGRAKELIPVLDKAVEIEPYDEALHVWLIRAYIAAGDRREAAHHYNATSEMLFTRLGVTPSQDLADLYQVLAQSENMTELNLGVVRSNLSEAEGTGGAFYCEYGVFREIFQLEARSCARTGQTVQLSMISVLESREKPMTAKQLRVAMERLHGIISSALRMGDTYTRYSANQYLILLPSASIEAANAITERVLRSFRRLYPKTNAVLHHSALPLPPKQ